MASLSCEGNSVLEKQKQIPAILFIKNKKEPGSSAHGCSLSLTHTEPTFNTPVNKRVK